MATYIIYTYVYNITYGILMLEIRLRNYVRLSLSLLHL